MRASLTRESCARVQSCCCDRRTYEAFCNRNAGHVTVLALNPAVRGGGVIPPSTIWGTLGPGPGQFQSRSGSPSTQRETCTLLTLGTIGFKSSRTWVFIAQWGTPGSEDGQFDQAQDICVGQNGSIYVVEDQNQRVQRFSSEGVFEGKWGHFDSCDGNFQNPTASERMRWEHYVADAGMNVSRSSTRMEPSF